MARRSIHSLRGMKERGERFCMVTCYDYPSARAVEEARIPAVLVGDSLGTVLLGYDSTVAVTLEDILHHVKPVVRGTDRTIVVADMPFGSYQASDDEAMRNATRLLKEGGATAIKLEGGSRVVPLVRRMVAAGIPVMGHLGLTPQSVNQFGGHKVQGKSDADASASCSSSCRPDSHARSRRSSLAAPCTMQVMRSHDETLTLGHKTLRFILAPWVHYWDSTWWSTTRRTGCCSPPICSCGRLEAARLLPRHITHRRGHDVGSGLGSTPQRGCRSMRATTTRPASGST